jgi:hypothetical protein
VYHAVLKRCRVSQKRLSEDEARERREKAREREVR